jgi:hypothetical protein
VKSVGKRTLQRAGRILLNQPERYKRQPQKGKSLQELNE